MEICLYLKLKEEKLPLYYPASRGFFVIYVLRFTIIYTKPPCWDAKVVLKQDKQRRLPFKIMYAFYWSCPSATFASQRGGFVPREWQAAKGLFDK